MRRLALILLLVLIADAPTRAVVSEPGETPPADLFTHAKHVRALDSRAARLLDDTLERSATVRQLVRALERADVDVIVFIELSPFLRNDIGGLLTFVSRAGKHRFLRLVVNCSVNRREQMILLGHELRHAVEVAEAPWIVDEQSFLAHYERIGDRHGLRDRLDTQAARATEEVVAREIASSTRHSATVVGRAFQARGADARGAGLSGPRADARGAGLSGPRADPKGPPHD